MKKGDKGRVRVRDLKMLFCLAEKATLLAVKKALEKAKVGLAQSWRGIPSTSGGVAILGVN